MTVKTAVEKKQVWCQRVARHIFELNKLIEQVPSKGDTERSCQHCVLVNRLNGLRQAVDGTQPIDFLTLDELNIVNETED